MFSGSIGKAKIVRHLNIIGKQYFRDVCFAMVLTLKFSVKLQMLLNYFGVAVLCN